MTENDIVALWPGRLALQHRIRLFVVSLALLLASLHLQAAWAQTTSPCDNAGPFGVPGLQLPPDEIGEWGPAEQWPIQAQHSNLLPTGKVLFWREEPLRTVAVWVWDPIANTFGERPSPSNVMCAGHAALADGRTIVIGGTFEGIVSGLPDTNIFDPYSESWVRVADMAVGRWYPTATALPDGRILAVSGHIKHGPLETATIPEVYDVDTDTWVQLNGAELLLPTYPFNFVLPNGKIFTVGPSNITQALDVDTQTWEVVGSTNPSFAGSAVMYRPGKVVKIGIQGQDRIDMTVESPTWGTLAPMEFPRRELDLVLLPDGTVLAVGGSVAGVSAPECAIHAAEFWDPDTEVWTTLASMERPRIYHSTALLLPDGRVLAAGGENSVTGGEENAEIYSPPYLFKGPRPSVDSAPTEVSYGSKFRVDTQDPRSIVSVSFIRPGAVTHGFDGNQRFVPLDFRATGNHLRVTAPANANVAPPGQYMLFLVSSGGVPSEARFVGLDSACTATEEPEFSCADGVDNDCDGLVDGNDPDCGSPPVCDGDGICEVSEDCQDCSTDCDGRQTGKPAKRFCCGDGIPQSTEGDGTICDGNF